MATPSAEVASAALHGGGSDSRAAGAVASAVAGEDAAGTDCNAVDGGTAEVIGSASKEVPVVTTEPDQPDELKAVQVLVAESWRKWHERHDTSSNSARHQSRECAEEASRRWGRLRGTCMTHIREADRIQGEIARELRSVEAVQSADELKELTEVERISGLCAWVGTGATRTKKAAQAVILHKTPGIGWMVLLGKRCKRPMEGQWFLFGGKADGEEDELTTAMRECKEEVRLDVPDRKRWSEAWSGGGIVGGNWELVDFVVILSGEEKLALSLQGDEEHSRKLWWSVDRLAELAEKNLAGDRLVDRVAVGISKGEEWLRNNYSLLKKPNWQADSWARVAETLEDSRSTESFSEAAEAPAGGCNCCGSADSWPHDCPSGQGDEFQECSPRMPSWRQRLRARTKARLERKEQLEGEEAAAFEDSSISALWEEAVCNVRSNRGHSNPDNRRTADARLKTSKPRWYRKVPVQGATSQILLTVLMAMTALATGTEDCQWWSVMATTVAFALTTARSAWWLRGGEQNERHREKLETSSLLLSLWGLAQVPVQVMAIEWMVNLAQTACIVLWCCEWALYGWKANQRMWEIMEVAETDFKRYHAMLVRIELEDGRVVAALADTGAMTSVWSWNSLPGLTAKLGLRPSKMSLRHAGGGGMQMAGEASPEFKFKGGTEWVKRPVQIAAKGVMPDGLRILGVEVWDSLNATINFHKRCITVRYKSGKVEDIPFTVTRKDSPVLGAIASLTGDNHEMQGSPVARLRDGVRLAPGQSAQVQVAQLGNTSSDTWEAFWEPAPISMALGDCSLGTEQDFTCLQFSTQGFIPCKQEGNRLIATVQLLNPTDQWLDLAPGQVIGKVDWAQQIPAEDVLGEELDVRRYCEAQALRTMIY